MPMNDVVNVAVTAVVSRHAVKVGYVSAPEASVAIEFSSSAGIIEPFGHSFPIEGCNDLCLAESVGRLVAWWYLHMLDAEPAYLQDLSLRRVDGEIVVTAVLSLQPHAEGPRFVLRFPGSSSVDRADAEARSHLHRIFAEARTVLAPQVRGIADEFSAAPHLWELVPAEARSFGQRHLLGPVLGSDEKK
jgi:hypothetical protein